jgi:acetyl esterase
MALVRDFTIDGGHGAVTLREFRPISAQQTPLPALLYFHGGGWVIGDIETHDTLCRQLAVGSGAVVFSVNYSKSPEHRFPVAIDECIAATRYVIDQCLSLGIDASRVGVGGDSAGGNLATVVALTLRGQLNQPLACQLLIYPVTDLRLGMDSIDRYASGYGLTAAAMRYFRDVYLRDISDQKDFRASPLLASDLSKLPPALVLTAGFDPLRDEGRAYADALSAAGNQVQYVCFERQIHGFIIMGGIIGEANTAVAMCATYLRTCFN